MCGRYVLFGPKSRLVDFFGLDDCVDFSARYNIAPQSDVVVIRQHPERGRVGVFHRWGLIPSWAKEPSIGARLNNARAESVSEKPSFRAAFRRSRCLIPADGFYEWQAVSAQPRKQPWYICPAGDEFFAFAGLVECWTSPAAERVLSVCVITTEANEAMRPIHDRMPVMIPPASFAQWLDPSHRDIDALGKLMVSCAADRIRSWPVDRAVSRASNEGEILIRPLGPESAAADHPPGD